MVTDDSGSRSMGVAPQIFCRSCASPLVQASNWKRDEDSCWHVRLWCPECEFDRIAILDRKQAAYLSLAIEAGFASLIEALEELHTSSGATGGGMDRTGGSRPDRFDSSGP